MVTMRSALAEAEALSMYANDPAKLRECNKWVEQARPIIHAWIELDAPQLTLMSALFEADEDQTRRRDYDEALERIAIARRALFAMFDGIRDNFIADQRCGIGDSDDEAEAADEFNDWLRESTITVDHAVKIVASEEEKSDGRGC